MNTATQTRLADMIVAQLVALVERHTAGRLTDAAFEAAAVALLTRAQAQGAALADIAAAAEVGRLRGTVLAAIGLEVREDAAGHARAELAAARARPEWDTDPVAAATVLASAVTLAAAQEATDRAYREHGVRQWVRVPNVGACELCQELADMGPAPAGVEPYHHKGCGCSSRPVN
ncbi:hypothetical protein GCM10010977_02520 [Citricoccus zhacaiensis]|uniref:MuF-like minor capsid protein n=1 Tax=Citricoccus zhacaiensis TaxID=489142 RepID=A0ABQ2LN98_9MICC|nr:hypothetical protein [Citricoccus zhacaiensis]GGO40354.1 hypothetical protein GCM10010977_02520 [Citricoccus zhacaiensis]